MSSIPPPATTYLCAKADLPPPECAALQQLSEGDIEQFLKYAAMAGGAYACAQVGAAWASPVCASIAGKIVDYILTPGTVTGCSAISRPLPAITRSNTDLLYSELRPGEYVLKRSNGAYEGWPMVLGGDPNCIPFKGFRENFSDTVSKINVAASHAGGAEPIAAKDWNGVLYVFDPPKRTLTRSGVDRSGKPYTIEYQGLPARKIPPPITLFSPLVMQWQPTYPDGAFAVFDAALNKFRILIPS